MANFTNTIGSVGNLNQADTINMGNVSATFTVGSLSFGAPAATPADLQPQIADLKTVLADTPDLPEETRTEVAAALDEAEAATSETPETAEAPETAAAPAAAGKMVGALETAKTLLESATGVAQKAAPLIGAIGAVIGAASGIL